VVREAAALLEAAGRLIRDERKVLSVELVERASAMLQELLERPELDEVRPDLEAVGSELARARDRSARQILEELLRRSPGEHR
jgi:hypothetical protein